MRDRQVGFPPFAHRYAKSGLEYIFEPLRVRIAGQFGYLLYGHVCGRQVLFDLFQPKIFDCLADGIARQFPETAVNETAGDVSEMLDDIVDAYVVHQMRTDVFHCLLHQMGG